MRSRPSVAVVVALVAVLAGCSDSGPDRDADGRITSSGDIDVFDLQVGDCLVLDDSVEPSVEKLPATPCDEPHQGEVYALHEIDDEELDTYPGERELSNRAETACVAEFADYVGVDLADSTLFFTYLVPSIRGWQDGNDRTVVCLAVTAGETIEQSVARSGL